MDRSSYIAHRIPKRSGGWREILEPIPEVKTLQRRVLAWLSARKIHAGRHAHGFVRYRSILTHARLHAGRKVVIRVDVRDFFPSITSTAVQSSLLHESVPLPDARRITDICTVDGKLPQGAPTSPFLANLVFKRLDVRLAALAQKFRPNFPGAYSRYADDLVLSSDAPDWHLVLHPVRKIVESAGFRLHPRKTHIARSHTAQNVTGLVVNARPNVPREYRRNLRACLHNIRAQLRLGKAVAEDWQVLHGKASFVHQINPALGRELRTQVDDLETWNTQLALTTGKEELLGRDHD